MTIHEVIDSIAVDCGLTRLDLGATGRGIGNLLLRYSGDNYRYSFVYNPNIFKITVWRMVKESVGIKLLDRVSVNLCNPDSIDLIKNFIR